MKKLSAVLLALCLLLSVAVAETIPEINWETFEAAINEAGIQGDFYTFNDLAVKFWVPQGLNAVELTAEDAEKGYIGYFTSEDGATLAFLYVNAEGLSLEDYAAWLQGNEEITDVEIAVVNGLPCVNYRMPAQDSVNVAFTTEAGYILEVVCGPVTTDEEKLGASVILASIQSAE